MKMIRRRAYSLLVLIIAFLFGTAFLLYSFSADADEWALKSYNKHLYNYGTLVGAGTVYDSNDIALAKTVDHKRVYAEDRETRRSTLHIVGDPQNFITTGVQRIYGTRLTGYNKVFGVYSLKKYGKGDDLKLTIDSEICNRAYEALDGRKGTVGVVNYKTGDIICCVSNPTYDVNNPPSESEIESDDDYEGLYINRLFSARYVPGSTFKIVTAICAIENMPDVFERTWDCGGEFTPKKGVDIICNADHGHHVDFETALAKSCNATFAQIAIELGSDKLNETAKRLGIGSSVTVSGEIKSSAGTWNVKGAADDKLGWTGIGQGDTRIAPITMMRIVSAIGNDGSAVSMNVIESAVSQAGKALNITLPTNKTQLMDEDVASKIKSMLRNNVKKQYGDYNYKGLKLCAKSGTAQIDEVEAHNIAWFTGFMDDDDCPYAFVVAIEHGNSGSQTAGPVANKVMQAVAEKYRK